MIKSVDKQKTIGYNNNVRKGTKIMKKQNKSKKDDAMTTKELISQLLALDPNLIIATVDECDFDEEDE